MTANTGGGAAHFKYASGTSVRTSFLVEGSAEKCLERGAVRSCAGFPLRNQLHRQLDSYM